MYNAIEQQHQHMFRGRCAIAEIDVLRYRCKLCVLLFVSIFMIRKQMLMKLYRCLSREGAGPETIQKPRAAVGAGQ